MAKRWIQACPCNRKHMRDFVFVKTRGTAINENCTGINLTLPLNTTPNPVQYLQDRNPWMVRTVSRPPITRTLAFPHPAASCSTPKVSNNSQAIPHTPRVADKQLPKDNGLQCRETVSGVRPRHFVLVEVGSPLERTISYPKLFRRDDLHYKRDEYGGWGRMSNVTHACGKRRRVLKGIGGTSEQKENERRNAPQGYSRKQKPVHGATPISHPFAMRHIFAVTPGSFH